MEMLPKSEADQRLRRIQQWMQDQTVDAVFILQNADMYYFAGTVQSGILCLPSAGEPICLIQKSAARARIESPWARQLPLKGLKHLAGILADEGCGDLRTVGLEFDVLPAGFFMRFRGLLPEVNFVDASDTIRKVRMIKSPYEAGQVRLAAGMLKETFHRIPDWVKQGVSELEISARLEKSLRLQGHQGTVRMRGFNNELFFGAVSSGPSASYPTGFPGPVGSVGLYPAVPGGAGERRLEDGDTLMVDIVGGYGGYLADKTRTFVLGRPPRDMADAHEFILEMMREIESMLKPGTSCAEIYNHSLARVKGTPYADNFMGVGEDKVRFLGHGVGLELDELPVLAPGSDLGLESGMTIAIEPKIFFPGRGGVGIENTYLITDSGYENLTVFPEEIIRV